MPTTNNNDFSKYARERALSRFELVDLEGIPENIEPPPKKIELDWKTKPVSPEYEKDVKKIIISPGEYGWMDDDEVSKIAKYLENKKSMTIDQALSLRKAILQEKSVHRHRPMMNESTRLLKSFEGGESIVSIAKRRDYPALNVLRAILSARKWSKARIKEAMRNPEKKLEEKYLLAFHEASEVDRISSADQSETHDRSARFEDVIAHHLDNNGVRFRTQDVLVQEQTKLHGRPTNTPDLLILDDLRINKQPVAWIDAKHYYGADLRFPIRKTKKQMKRYAETWGQGAIVYRHGFNRRISIPGVILLDSNILDLSLMEMS